MLVEGGDGRIMDRGRAVRIVATGAAVPGKRLEAEELDRQLGLHVGTSFKQTGIRSRFLSTDETASQLAAAACREALERSGMSWDDVDCLVAACATMDQALPFNAAMIHAELGLEGRRTTTFDVGASCLSFLAALDVCTVLVDAGRFRRVMIVSADISTFTTDRSDLRTNGIFGDGAAACLIEKSEGVESSILASNMITLSEGVEHCQIRAGGSRFHRRVAGSEKALFQMRPRPLYALVARELPGFVDRLLATAGVRKEEIDLVVPHQASHLALQHLRRSLGIDRERLVDISATHGNQVGASLPTALHHGLAEGKVARGSKILLLGSGAGVTIGGVVLIH